MERVAVVGASGFVGGAVAAALEAQGVAVKRIRAPRLDGGSDLRDSPSQWIGLYRSTVQSMVESFVGCSAVVNAAGNPDASASTLSEVYGPNALLPGVLAAAAREAGVVRFVHLSSAVVQGDAPELTESKNTKPFSPYARSKADGERNALAFGPRQTVVYRPPSVHHVSRRITQSLHRIARSRLATIAGGRPRPTPQALLGNVAGAVAFLASCETGPPSVVIHPWEGRTTENLLADLGGRKPSVVPLALARAIVFGLKKVARLMPNAAPNVRRLELVWFGQRQASSWLTSAGWAPATGEDSWRAMGQELDARHRTHDKNILFGVTTGLVAKSFFEDQFSHLASKGWAVSFASPKDGTALELVRSEGVTHHELDASRKPSPARDLRLVADLVRIIRLGKYGLTVWGTPKIGLLGTLASRLAGTYSIYVVHGLRYESARGLKRHVLAQFEKLACALANEVVAVSKDVQGELLSNSLCARDKLHVLGSGSANGVGQPNLVLSAKDYFGLEGTTAVFGYVGRVTRDKGIGELLTAWEIYHARVPASRLLIAGIVEEDAKVGPLGAALQTAQGCLFLGYLSDLSSLYSAIDVLVLPSYREGLPTVVLEAASYGVPSIVTDVTGARESVLPDLTGLVVPVRNPLALRDAMAAMTDNSDMRKRLGQNAKEYVTRNFSRDVVHAHWAGYFEECLSRARGKKGKPGARISHD